VDQRQQFRAEFPLGDKAIRPHGLGRGAVFGVIVQRQDDDAWRVRLRLDVARRSQAVHPRHRYVH
jgi:hypothetical protein